MSRIRISTRAAVANPCLRADIMQYEGPFDVFLAEHMAPYAVQRRNYAQLAASLEPHGICLDHVWAGQFMGYGAGGRRISWLACDAARTVFWHKAESRGPGTGHNHVYIHGRRMKLTAWLAMAPNNQRALLLGGGGGDYVGAEHISDDDSE